MSELTDTRYLDPRGQPNIYPKVFVVLQTFEHRDTDQEPPETTVLAVYMTFGSVLRRMEAIARKNRQYPMERLSETSWRIGPSEDEGFFGNRPVNFRVVEKEMTP